MKPIVYFIFIWIILDLGCSLEQELPSPFETILSFIHENLLSTLNKTSSFLSTDCQKNITFILLDENSQYITKFFYDSADNRNDVESFIYCSKNSPKLNYSDTESKSFYGNLTYSIIQINKKNWVNIIDLRYKSGRFLLGVCFIKYCTENDFSIFFTQFNQEIGNPLGLSKNDELTVYDMQNYEINYQWQMLAKLIPFIIMLTLILFAFVPSIPGCLLSCCIKKAKIKKSEETNIFDLLKEDGNLKSTFIEEELDQYNSRNITIKSDSKENKISLTRQTLTDETNLREYRRNEFILCFKFLDNYENFFEIKNSMTYNESGINILRGIQGFSIIFMIIGNIYLYLLLSPLKIYSVFQHKLLVTSTFLGVLQVGMRYAPRMLLACSGFSLSFKLLSYLDNICENEVSSMESEPEIEEDPNYIMLNFTSKKILEKLRFSHLSKFLLSQSYKYILYVLVIFFFKYSFYELPNLFVNPGTMWVYLKLNIIDKMSFYDLLATIFLLRPIIISGEEIYFSFWLSQNEILYYIFSSIVIFLCFKKNWRMDIFFLITFNLIIVYRLTFYFFLSENKIYPILGDYYDGKLNFFLSPIYNYSFFIIGIYFGLVNYVFQNTYNEETIKMTGRTYLNSAVYFKKFFRTSTSTKTVASMIFGSGAVVFLSLSYPIFYTILSEGTQDKYLGNFHSIKALNIFYLFDNEIFILVALTVLFGLFILRNNFFLDFFSHAYWRFITRSYFSYILICDMSILFIFYQSEMQIKLEIFSILFFSLFFAFFTALVSFIFHIFFEIPFKRLTKKFLESEKVEIKYNMTINNSLKKDKKSEKR
jgi:hypothetical protein